MRFHHVNKNMIYKREIDKLDIIKFKIMWKTLLKSRHRLENIFINTYVPVSMLCKETQY